MKKTLTLIIALVVCLISGNSMAQEKADVKIKKEVRMEDENGVKTLTITTTSNGTVTEEIYTGAEAEAKLAEMMDGRGETNEIKREVEVEEVNGEIQLTLITSKKGKIRKEIYTGAEAEKKMQELDGTPTGKIIKEKRMKK